MLNRRLKLPLKPTETFFLWGPRQVGKSSLLKETYPQAKYLDLLKNKTYLRYFEEPWLLSEEMKDYIKTTQYEAGLPVIIDEIQKVPALLDEVHWCIENLKVKFALCGSSARKLKRGQANLLGGRAIRYELRGLSAAELGDNFDLKRMLNHGYLPRHYLSDKVQDLLEFYVADYLKEEIIAEAAVRKIQPFSKLLWAASFSDTEAVNYSNIARECGISVPTVIEYFQILEDTLIANLLPAYTRRAKRKVVQSPKFYYCDVGITNHLAKRGDIQPKSELFGKAFENWVHHELRAYNSYHKKFWDLSYWRLASGAAEVDFIINDMECAIEAKGTDKIKKDELHGLRELIKDQETVKKRIVVSLVDTSRLTDDGIEILNYTDFITRLWSGKIL